MDLDHIPDAGVSEPKVGAHRTRTKAGGLEPAEPEPAQMLFHDLDLSEESSTW